MSYRFCLTPCKGNRNEISHYESVRGVLGELSSDPDVAGCGNTMEALFAKRLHIAGKVCPWEVLGDSCFSHILCTMSAWSAVGHNQKDSLEGVTLFGHLGFGVPGGKDSVFASETFNQVGLLESLHCSLSFGEGLVKCCAVKGDLGHSQCGYGDT